MPAVSLQPSCSKQSPRAAAATLITGAARSMGKEINQQNQMVSSLF